MTEDEEIYKLCAKLFIKWAYAEDRAESIAQEPEYNDLKKALDEVAPEETADEDIPVKLFFIFYAGMGAGLELFQTMKQFGDPELTAWELDIIHHFRSLPPEGQDFISGMIQGYSEAQRKQACKVVQFQPRK